MTMQKIGLITDSIDMGAPGISRYIRNLVTAMLLQDTSNEFEFFLIHQEKNSDPIYHLPRIKEIIIEAPRIPMFKREIRKFITLSKALKRYSLDIVHDLAQVGPFFLKSDFKKIETVYDLTPIRFPKFHPFASYLRTKFGLPLILKQVDHFISISNNTKSDLIKYYRIKPEAISTIHLGVEEQFKIITHIQQAEIQGLDINQPYLLFVGTVEPRKNISKLIEAYNIIKLDYPLMKLVIVGKKGWKCEKIIKSFYENAVIWLNNITDAELTILYNKAQVMVFPSLYEGFGLPVLEAMACGCPVVVSDTEIMREVAGDAVIIVDAYDAHAIAVGVNKFLSNDILRQMYIEKALAYSTTYSWKKCAEKTLATYKKIIKTSKYAI